MSGLDICKTCGKWSKCLKIMREHPSRMNGELCPNESGLTDWQYQALLSQRAE